MNRIRAFRQNLKVQPHETWNHIGGAVFALSIPLALTLAIIVGMGVNTDQHRRWGSALSGTITERSEPFGAGYDNTPVKEVTVEFTGRNGEPMDAQRILPVKFANRNTIRVWHSSSGSVYVSYQGDGPNPFDDVSPMMSGMGTAAGTAGFGGLIWMCCCALGRKLQKKRDEQQPRHLRAA